MTDFNTLQYLDNLTEEQQLEIALKKSEEDSNKGEEESKKGEEESKKGEESEDFHIYTTGILDSGNLCSVINAWEKIVRERIIVKIQLSYKNIYIHHYDMHPIDDITTKRMKTVNENDESYVKKSEFINKEINLSIINKNHIIIDFAHIFKYSRSGPVLNEYVLSSYELKYNYISKFKLNVIYFGYIGEYQISDEGFSSQYIAKNSDLIYMRFNQKNYLFKTSQIFLNRKK